MYQSKCFFSWVVSVGCLVRRQGKQLVGEGDCHEIITNISIHCLCGKRKERTSNRVNESPDLYPGDYQTKQFRTHEMINYFKQWSRYDPQVSCFHSFLPFLFILFSPSLLPSCLTSLFIISSFSLFSLYPLFDKELFYLCMCLYVCLLSVCSCLQKSKESDSCRGGGTGSCEPPDGGVWKWTWILQNDIICS